MTDAESRLTTDGYDTLSRLTSVTNTAIQSTPLLQESYSPNGRLASLTDALGHATSFAYDGLDRLGTTTYPGGSTEVLGYDNDSNVTSLQTRAGATIQYGYDNLNRRSSKTPPSPAPVVTYSYDLADRLTGVSDTSAAIPTVAVPGGGSGVQYTSYFYYDQINRLTGTVFDSVSAVTAPASSSVVFNHWYNKVNQRTYQTVNDNSYWDYPAASASSVSYGANTLNQYTAVGSATPSYDGNGNLTGDGTFTYGYDAENRLTSASGAGNTASYGYDASGRRKSKTVNGTSTYYLSDGDREVLEYDGSGNVLRRYTHGDGIDEVLNLVDVSGSRALLVPDIQGSLIASVDSTSGTITQQGVRAYGESANATGSFRYTGRRIDAETLGLYYYRARMYHPTLGRFMQPDPTGYAGGANLYAYVGNDPLNRLDPFGLCDNPSGCGGSNSSFGEELASGAWSVVSGNNKYFNNYLYEGWDSISRAPGDMLGYARDLVNSPTDFLQKASPGLAGLGMSIPVVGAGNATVWDLPPVVRGEVIDVSLGRNLPGNFPVLDRFVDGLATSIKSIDLDAATYQNVSALGRTLTGYIDKVADFAGRTWGGATVRVGDITGRALDVAVPNAGTSAQQGVINQAIQYGSQRGVTVNIVPYP